MSNISINIESKGIAELNHVQGYRAVVPTRFQQKNIKLDAIKMRISRYVIEVIKSSLVVGACLALYINIGVHAWWIKFVQEVLFKQ